MELNSFEKCLSSSQVLTLRKNLEIRLTQVKFGQYFQVPVINAGTHFAQNLENRPPPPNEQPVAEGDGLREIWFDSVDREHNGLVYQTPVWRGTRSREGAP